MAERQSCKLNVPGSIPSGACSGPRETSRRKRGKPRRRQDRQVDRRDPGKAKRCKTAQKKHTAQTKNAAGKSETAQNTRKKTRSADEENGRPRKRSRRVNSVQGGRCLQNGAGAWRACWTEDAYRTERARGQLVGDWECTQACARQAFACRMCAYYALGLPPSGGQVT